MKELEVVAAILEYDGKILCMQRNVSKYSYTSLKFEFPGGKVEPGETHPQALERELREEMDKDVNITDKDYFMTIHHVYPDFAITMHAYKLKINNPTFIMKEHIGFKWASLKDLNKLDWAAADIDIVNKLVEDME
ncbi:MAG: (deoxy)nucleoside triphosphate pyrophosphohydrolase [Clostridia bacterium]|nr:(deoxy)nucleoside triphosphate pyrophosphohydrolase [Clostridia bacterium]